VRSGLAFVKMTRTIIFWVVRMLQSSSAELILNELIRSIALEGLIPEGSVIDAGANQGQDTCAFASMMPTRTVHGLDPLQRNIASLKQLCGSNPNVRPLLGGLGAAEQTLHVPASKSRYGGQQISIASRTSGESPIGKGTRDGVAVLNVIEYNNTGQEFLVWPVDQLFATQWRDERLGFAHWDTEGNELDILRGAVGTLRRDAPIFTVEIVVHKSPQYTAALLASTLTVPFWRVPLLATLGSGSCGADSLGSLPR
tara:strand:- start:562 stop:1326 length:765 start_codon:yes stop_codon:yes gene_type:complete